MKKIAIVLALGLTACVPLPSIDIATATSRNILDGIVNGYGVALSAETTYKNLCIQGIADVQCKDNVVRMQAADKKAIASIVAANNFIKQYPTVDSSNFISAAQQAVSNFKSITGAK